VADDSFATGFIAGILVGVLVGIPCGYVVAQALKPKTDSLVTLERNERDKVVAIMEKHLG